MHQLIKGKEYSFTVRNEGEYIMTYIDTVIDKYGDIMLHFENDITDDIYDPETIEFSKNEIIIIQLSP